MAKGTGPSDSLSKLPKLTAELQKFIDGMGVYFESQGIPRIGGRMLGVLMIAHWPLTPEDMANVLQVSRGSISTNLRMLTASGMVERALMPGSRLTHFAFSDEAMEHRIAAGIRSTQAFRRLVQEASAALPGGDPSRHHLVDSLEWSDLLLEALHNAIEHWKAHRAQGSHSHTVRAGE